jgi:hypothetical protein
MTLFITTPLPTSQSDLCFVENEFVAELHISPGTSEKELCTVSVMMAEPFLHFNLDLLFPNSLLCSAEFKRFKHTKLTGSSAM